MTGTFPQLSETFVYRHAVTLARAGLDVTVLARDAGDSAAFPDPLPPGMRVEIAAPDGNLRSPRRMLALAAGLARAAGSSPREVRALYERCRTDPRTRSDPHRQLARHLALLGRTPDVVHFEFLGGGAMYPLAGEITGAPVVVSCRGSDVHLLELQPEPARSAMLACLRDAAAVHCVSAELAAQVERLVGRRDGVWVNRPAVDVERISVRPPARPGAPLRIVTTARLSWKKGFDYLFATLGRLRAAGIAFEATILGGGEMESAARFTIEDLGLTDRVHLIGAVTPRDVLDHLQRADVFVLTTLDEGISNAALEAMASGVAVVSSRVGGMPEAITDGVEGFLVPVRDVDGFTAAIERLARDRELCARMGEAARRRAVAEFGLDRQVRGFVELYASL